MSSVQVIDHLVEEARKQVDPSLNANDFFELFVSELITRDYGFDWEDVESGIVDGSNDGQIDAIYILVDGFIIKEKKEFDPAVARRNAEISVIVQQSKNRESFEENLFSKLRASLSDLFDLEINLSKLKKAYNSDVIGQIDLFRHVYLGMQGKNPSVIFDIVYASKGDKNTVNARIQADAGAIEKFFEGNYFNSAHPIRLLGSRELLDLANRPRFINKKIQFIVTPAADSSNDGWVGLVRLDEFFKFITDDARKLLTSMFEENVRDFEGDKGVNKEIAETLEKANDKVDFWWLNNGVTILCDGAQPHTQRDFSLDRPLIVNGLQTATMIWQFFASRQDIQDARHILLRIIKSTDEAVRDRIIRATNRQTPIGPSQLRATETLHRDIEGYFKSRSKFYERRKNQYKNAGRPKRDIFSINELAQAVIAVYLGRPNDARARPSTILNNPEGYKEIFRENASLPFYSFCAELVRAVEHFLMQKSPSRKDRNNLRFYVAFIASRLMCGKIDLKRNELAALLAATIDTPVLDVAFRESQRGFVALGADDDTARGSELIARLKARLPGLLKKHANLRIKTKVVRRKK